METAIDAFIALGHFNHEQFNGAWLFQTNQKTDRMNRRRKHQQDFKILRVDEGNHADHCIDYEVHIAYAHDHGRAGKPLKERVR